MPTGRNDRLESLDHELKTILRNNALEFVLCYTEAQWYNYEEEDW
jgi:hypothetical protein